MTNKATHVFLNSASAATDGTEFPVYNTDPLSKFVVSFTGGMSSKTIDFEGKNLNGNYVPLLATNMATGTTGSQTTSVAAENWSIPTMGMKAVRCKLVAISGSITAQGIYVTAD